MRGKELIKEFEGLRLVAYKPIPEDPWTIGYGHTGGVKEGGKITKSRAELILFEDLKVYENCVNANVLVPLEQCEFDALVSFCFNLGCPNLKVSTLLLKLNAGDKPGAALEFPRWNKAAGKVMAGLTRRRKAEQALFTGGA